jgi:hypothetical protein
VYKLSAATGAVQWSYKTQGKIHDASPVVSSSGQRIYVGSEVGAVAALGGIFSANPSKHFSAKPSKHLLSECIVACLGVIRLGEPRARI